MGADAYDALKLAWLHRAAGGSFVGISYDLVGMAAQIAIAFLSGVGPSLEVGSHLATVQIGLIMAVQFGSSAYVFLLGPSADRIDNGLVATQFFVEGSMTLALYLSASASNGESAGGLQDIAFVFALIALFLPLIEKVTPPPRRRARLPPPLSAAAEARAAAATPFRRRVDGARCRHPFPLPR